MTMSLRCTSIVHKILYMDPSVHQAEFKNSTFCAVLQRLILFIQTKGKM